MSIDIPEEMKEREKQPEKEPEQKVGPCGAWHTEEERTKCQACEKVLRNWEDRQPSGW